MKNDNYTWANNNKKYREHIRSLFKHFPLEMSAQEESKSTIANEPIAERVCEQRS